jgi:2-keto-4-pentenoate hydratase/2-oxohepta-3-ene-1,7-dioic acid hydratase in catechol pathway
MRLIRFDQWQTGVMVTDDEFVDVGASVSALSRRYAAAGAVLSELLGDDRTDWRAMIERWDEARPALEALLELAKSGGAGAVSRRMSDVSLLPPLPSPTPRVFALGSNFADHGARAKTKILGREVTEAEVVEDYDRGLPPWGYLVLASSIVPSGAEVTPADEVTMLDYEVEVAVVLRSGGKRLAVDDVSVWGYTGWNDLSIRDHFFNVGPAIDRGILIWTLAKNFDGGNPCGVWMCVDEDADVQSLPMRLRVNGEQRQYSTSAKMIYSFAETAAHLSEYVRLEPGDMITSGTPAGPAVEDGPDGRYLQPGDKIEMEVGGAGILRTTIGKMAAGSRSAGAS